MRQAVPAHLQARPLLATFVQNDGMARDVSNVEGDAVPSRVRFERLKASDVPQDRDELTSWLYARWIELDGWVGEQLEAHS